MSLMSVTYENQSSNIGKRPILCPFEFKEMFRDEINADVLCNKSTWAFITYKDSFMAMSFPVFW